MSETILSIRWMVKKENDGRNIKRNLVSTADKSLGGKRHTVTLSYASRSRQIGSCRILETKVFHFLLIYVGSFIISSYFQFRSFYNKFAATCSLISHEYSK